MNSTKWMRTVVVVLVASPFVVALTATITLATSR